MTSPPITAHGTPDAPLLTVRGEAELDAEPDTASIALTLTARGRDRRTTLDGLTHRNTTALGLLTSYGDAVQNLSTGAFSLIPELTERGRGERVRNYQGHVRISAEFTDFTLLGELTTRLADLDLTRVDGPWWTLRPDAPVHAVARRQAVRDAVGRAREYAEALGTTLAALVELADTGAPPPRPGRAAFERGGRRMSFAGGTDEPAEPLDLAPPRLRVTAQVTAQFTMGPPPL